MSLQPLSRCLQPCVLALATLLAGCSSAPQTVRVPVPVPCKAPMPQRPAMPTEALTADAALDDFVQAAAAEIERREGYEVQLRAAIEACAGGSVALRVKTAGAEQ